VSPVDLSQKRCFVDKRFYPLVHPETGESKKGPSVTTILDFVREKGFLDQWESEFIELWGVDGYKKFLEKKAAEGTMLHSLIELYLNRVLLKDPTPIEWTEGISGFVWKKFLNFKAWFEEHRPNILWMERTVQSWELGYGGRADLGLEMTRDTDDYKKGQLFVHDHKSSKSATSKHLEQDAAYIYALEEETGLKYHGVVVPFGTPTRKGYKPVYVRRDVPYQKGKTKSEYEYYLEAFLLKKKLFDHYFDEMLPEDQWLDVFVTPKF